MGIGVWEEGGREGYGYYRGLRDGDRGMEGGRDGDRGMGEVRN